MMTGKDRVLATINREPVDRVPIDLFLTPALQRKIIRDLNLSDSEELNRYLGKDIQYVGPQVSARAMGEYYGHLFIKQIDEHRYIDNWGITWQRAMMPSGDVFYDVVDHPLKQVTRIGELEKYSWPDPEDDFDFTEINAQIDAVHNRLAISSGTAAVFEDTWRLRGFENLLVDFIERPDLATFLLRKVCDYWMKFARIILETAPGRIDLMWTKDDLGTQNGLLVSREIIRQFVLPLVRERASLFKDFGATVVMHSCGGIYPIIDQLIRCGVEVLDPLQPTAKGMNRSRIKEEFGDRLLFHGSVDQMNTLTRGTVDDVAREVEDCLSTLGKGGGYILSASHEIDADTPTKNVLTMLEIAMNWRS